MPGYECDDCHKSFPTPSKLSAHKNRKFPCTAGDFPCGKCNATFTKRSARDRHRRGCQGLPETIEEVQEERDALRDLLAQQATGPSQVIIHNHNHNYNQVLNLTINNHVVVNVGAEDLKYIDKRLPSLEVALNLPQQNPKSLLQWCQMVHCDIDNPQNHNVLLTDPAAAKAWQFNGNWSEGDTNQLLTNMVGRDALRLSGCINDADDLYSRPDLRSYKNEYLNHGVIARAAQADYAGLAQILDPLKQMLSELTQKLYVTERAGEENKEDDAICIKQLEIDLAKAKLRKELKEVKQRIDPTVQGNQESLQNMSDRKRDLEAQAELLSLQMAERVMRESE